MSAENAAAWVFVGCGHMGSAILRGCLAAGTLAGPRVGVIEPDAARREALRDVVAQGVLVGGDADAVFTRVTPQGGGGGTGGVGAAAGECGGRESGAASSVRVMLAVKPQVFPSVVPVLQGRVSPATLVVSIMAGVRAETIAAALGTPRVVRVMPNLPAALGRGCSAVAAGAGASDGDADLVAGMFASVGTVVRIDESLIDAFTVLAGSGPAYLFYLAECLEEAGVALGFTREESAAIVRRTLVGSGRMLEASPEPAGVLRARVTSPGGTTAAATRVLDEAGLRAVFTRALIAGRDRGRELSGPGR